MRLLRCMYRLRVNLWRVGVPLALAALACLLLYAELSPIAKATIGMVGGWMCGRVLLGLVLGPLLFHMAQTHEGEYFRFIRWGSKRDWWSIAIGLAVIFGFAPWHFADSLYGVIAYGVSIVVGVLGLRNDAEHSSQGGERD